MDSRNPAHGHLFICYDFARRRIDAITRTPPHTDDARQQVRFRVEGDMDRLAKPAGSVESGRGALV